MGLITVVSVKRRQHGTYDEPENSRRQCTYKFVLPNGKGGFFQVCWNTFMKTFGTTKKSVEVLAQKKKWNKNTYEETRGGPNHVAMTDEMVNQVRRLIESFPFEDSHYRRKELQSAS